MKITEIEISNFRGIPNKANVLLQDKVGKPISAIIVGDNGTGKSSIVDAIEFVLQGRIHKTHNLGSGTIPSANSLVRPKDTYVRIKFDNNEIYTRSIINDEGKTSYNNIPLKKFNIAPIILRRKDILLFWNTPSFERQRVFFDFFRSQKNTWDKSPDILISDIKEEIIDLRKTRKKLITELEKKSKIKNIPVQIRLFTKTIEEQTVLKQDFLNPFVQEILEINQTITDLNKQVRQLNSSKTRDLNRKPNKQVLQATIEKIGVNITESFKSISPSGKILKSIKLEAGKKTDTDLSFIVKLTSNKKTSPIRVFSEANLDLLSLLTYLAFIKEASELGQEKILVLDDVFQSIDSTYRIDCVRYIVEEFKDWQIVLTTHDRLFSEQLREVFRQKSHQIIQFEISNWVFNAGPTFTSDGLSNAEIFRASLSTSQTYEICGQAGLLLERICNELSINLPISVTRKKYDKYTLGDLWPGINKTLKKTKLASKTEEINNWLILRNLVGAHYNEWSRSISRTEAEKFGNAVLDFYDSIYCEDCHKMIEQVKIGNASKKQWKCRCEKVEVKNFT